MHNDVLLCAPAMRSRHLQKAEERRQFIGFAALVGCVPAAVREQPAEPEPDVVIRVRNGLIGVELTEWRPHGYKAGAVDAEQTAMIRQARALYEAAGSSPVTAFITFGTGPLPKQSRRANAKRLAELIASYPPQTIFGRSIGSGFERIDSALPVVALTVFPAKSVERGQWRESDMHLVAPCGTEELRARLADEDRKPSRYRVPYTERWLVVILGADGPSTYGEILDEVDGTQFSSPYHRVFVYESHRGRVRELRVVNF